MLVATAVELLDAPVHVIRALTGWCCVELERLVSVGPQHGHLTVIEVDHLGRVVDHCGDIRADEHLLVADPDDHRRAVAGDDDAIRLRGIDHGEPVGALDAGEREPHRIFQVLARRPPPCDQVGEHLGVSVTGEDHAIGFECGPQLHRVLDDAVVHERDRSRHMRVRVHVIRRTVGRPAGVADADLAGQALRQRRLERPQLALLLAHPQFASVRDDGDPRGVVAAVLDPSQSFHEDRDAVPRSDRSDDAAHEISK